MAAEEAQARLRRGLKLRSLWRRLYTAPAAPTELADAPTCRLQRKKQRMSEDCEDRESPAAAAPPGQAAATAGAPGSTGAAAGSKIVLVWDLVRLG